MFALGANLNPLAAGADEVFERGVHIQGVSHLVEVGDLQIGALAHFAAVGGEFSQNHFEQRGFAHAIRADQTNLVATQKGGGEVLGDDFVAEGFADICEFGHDLAAGRAAREIELDTTHSVAPCFAARAQSLESRDAALAAGATRFDAFANPHLFAGQHFVGLGVDDGFLRELFFLLDLVLAEVARIRHQMPAVELNDARGDAV